MMFFLHKFKNQENGQAKVYIPILPADLKLGSDKPENLWVVVGGEATPEELNDADRLHSKNLEVTIAGFSPIGRYESARRAFTAVKNVTQFAAGNFLPLNNCRLRSVDGAGWVNQIIGNSSDLGLALCLLMAIGQCKTRVLAATGELGNAMETTNASDAVVKPVRGIPEKLQLIIGQKRQGLLADLTLLLLPKQYYLDQSDILEQVYYADDGVMPLSKLPEIEQLRLLGIKVVTVSTLQDAVERIGIKIYRWEKLGWFRLRYWLAAAFLCTIGSVLLANALSRTVDLAWIGRPDKTAEPYVVCHYEYGQSAKYADLKRNKRRTPVVPINSILGFHVQLGGKEEQNAKLNQFLHDWLNYKGLYVTRVIIGQKSGIINSDLPVIQLNNRFRPGSTINYDSAVNAVEETTLFVIMVNRWWMPDIATLSKELQHAFGNTGDDINLAAIQQTLLRYSDGSLNFIFTTEKGLASCE